MLDLNMTVTIYTTRYDDTIQGVARRFGHCKSQADLNAYLKRLLTLNSNLRQYYSSDETVYLPPHITVKLPPIHGTQTTHDPNHQFETDRLCQALNMQPAPTRRKVAEMLIYGDYDLGKTATVCRFANALKKVQHHSEAIASTGIVTSEQISDYMEESAREFRAIMLDVNSKLQTYITAPKGEKYALKQEFLKAHKQMNENFNKRIEKLAAKRTHVRKGYFMRDPNRLTNLAKGRRDGFSMLDTEEMQSITRAMRYAKYVGRSFLALEVGLAGDGVYNDYKSGKNWEKDLILASEVIAGGFIGGTLIMDALAAAPALLVISAGVAGAAASASFLEYIINEAWSISENA